jgi:Tfp pilus assembly protein PilO
MTLVSARSYRVLAWLIPVLIVIGARDLLLARLDDAYEHFLSMRHNAERVRRTGVHVRELPDMRRDFEDLARKKAAIASSLFGSASEAALYELLMQKARETDVAIVSVTPRLRRAGSGFVEQPLSLEVAGNYNGIAKFTNAIEKVGRLMRVEELAMEKDRSGRLTAAIQLLVYMYSDTLAAAPGAAKTRGQEAASQNRAAYLADLRAALAVTITPPAYTYTSVVKSDPFGTAAAQAGGKADNRGAAKKETFGFMLKGILWKEPPLAILESLDGKTYIVKQGESVSGMTVSSISRTDVVIATPQGDHVLHQYDQK